jgi:acyl-CoA synthetase (AMP-forming)/AMP-acid ligase II
LPLSDANIARHLGLMAGRLPQAPALKIPRGRTPAGDLDYLTLTFAGLDAEAAAWQARLTARGVRRGDRTLVMVRPGLPLIAATFALFRLGAVPVIIDPGMGRRSFLDCVARSRPRVLLGIPFAQIVSHVFRRSFSTVAVRITASGSHTARLAPPTAQVPTLDTPAAATDLAAILFTSGSTGSPKGVCYEHGMFDAQVSLIRETYGIAPGEIDLPLLPIFALFNPALGLTTIVPELDPRRPAELDPAKVVQAIRQENVTNSFGSPTLWRKIGDYCLAHQITLPSLRRVLCAGAPVPAALWRGSRGFLPNGELHSPYGATEALPLASISATGILAAQDPAPLSSDPKIGAAIPHPPGFGACVGRPLRGIGLKVIAPSDHPIATFAEVRELPPGEIGEIIASGAVVTKAYDALPEATARAKIQGEGGKVWHRLGDAGYLDGAGRLWFCGRLVERVETAQGTLHTEPCEQVFRTHARAARCALIGLSDQGRQRPALVVEASPKDSRECRALARELRSLALAHPHTAAIMVYFFHPTFPMDVRHNAKIHRLELARWAATAKGFMTDPKR